MNVPCVILAGGLGTRLQAEVPNLPKCLAPIRGLPFLAWQIQSLAERGFDKFIISLGYKAEDVMDSLAQSWTNGLCIKIIKESELLGTGGAIKFVFENFDLKEAVVTNGDTFLGGNLSNMFEPLDFSNNELMRIATVQVEDCIRFGRVEINEHQKVTKFISKGMQGRGIINAGMYRIHRKAFNLVKEIKFSIELDFMDKLINAQSLCAVRIDGPFIDIGVPADYRHFVKEFINYFK